MSIRVSIIEDNPKERRFYVDLVNHASELLCKSEPKRQPISDLSSREQQVLEKSAEGHRYRDIADELHISFHTVRAHIRRIYEKLHVHSRGQAVAKYFQERSPEAR